MHPRLFEWHLPSLPIVGDIGPLTSTPTACCWPRPTCSGCSSRWSAPRHAGSIRRACSTSASTSSSARSSARSCCCSITDFRSFASNPRALIDLARSGGVFYGGLILAVVGRALVHPPHRPAALDDVRRVRPGHRARSRRRTVRLLLRRLLLRQADRPCPGRSRSPIRTPRPTSARRSTSRCIRRSCTKPAPRR